MAAPHLSDPTAYVVQMRRPGGDTWHSYQSLSDAAAYALDLMRVVFDGKTYPVAIWHNQEKVWKPHGRSGKLHFASTAEALEALSRRAGAD